MNRPKYILFTLLFKNLFLVLVYINIFNTFSNNTIMMVLFWSFSLALMINDYIRSKFLNECTLGYNISIISTIIGCGVLNYTVKGAGVNTYFMFSLVEIFMSLEKISIILLMLHASMYLSVLLVQINGLDRGKSIYEFSINILGYLFMTTILYLYRVNKKEKEEVNKLNVDLKTANLMLKQYSMEIEELTIINERAKVAQELHDSLGHSLIALKMNLEYAENVVELKPERAKEIISKSHNISKECIINLRKAVNVLKEANEIKELRESINEIFYSFKEIDKLEFNFNMEEIVETANPDIKYCIYRTIKEAITNAIKHGEANSFNIDIYKIEDQIYLVVKDNGLGCHEIIKSNGLKGIESRINKLGGRVDFDYGLNCGFTIKVEIPEF